LKRRAIDQLIEHEEKHLRSTRHQAPVKDNTKTTADQLIISQYLIQIPEKSILNHQQVIDN
jgi:hypothetical protein